MNTLLLSHPNPFIAFLNVSASTFALKAGYAFTEGLPHIPIKKNRSIKGEEKDEDPFNSNYLHLFDKEREKWKENYLSLRKQIEWRRGRKRERERERGGGGYDYIQMVD